MATEGSANMFGPPGLKKPSLFRNLHGFNANSPNNRKSLGASGSKSEIGFNMGSSRTNFKGGRKTRGQTTNINNQFLKGSPNKVGGFDKSSMAMSRFSYMSANTVFL